MVSKLLLCISVLSCLMMIQLCAGRSVIGQVSPNSDPEKVSLALYYESLCPYCARFVINGLAPIFGNGIIDIVDLKLIPWGNAKIRPDNSFSCQHGPNECFLDTVEACAIDTWPALSDHFPFINCVESLVPDKKYTEWETCFEKLGLDPKPVKDCSSSKHGTELELKHAAATDALKPPHKYVPWVVVDGQPLYEDYENFTSYVCKAYKGTLPSACSSKSSENFLGVKTPQFHPVCYANKPTRSWMPQMMIDRDFIQTS